MFVLSDTAATMMVSDSGAGGSTTRRKHDRRRVTVNALVHRGDRFHHVRIVDYSSGGLQLDGTFGLMPGDTIAVELLSGLRITAKVVWSLGGRTGVAFDRDLSPGHAMMAELGWRERRKL